MTCLPLSEINRMKNMIKDDLDPVREKYIQNVSPFFTNTSFIKIPRNKEHRSNQLCALKTGRTLYTPKRKIKHKLNLIGLRNMRY